jgi:hypothetical protein
MKNKIDWMVLSPELKTTVLDISTENVIAIPPEKLLSNLFDPGIKYVFYKCPAFIDALRNVYIIRSPFDFSLRIHPERRSIEIDKAEDFAMRYINNRSPDNHESANMVFSFNYSLLFTSDDDIEIEPLTCLYHSNSFIDNTQIITGKFNIGKWTRPVELACIIKNSTNNITSTIEIDVKRGDPLMYVRFNPKDGKVVTLNQETDFDTIIKYNTISNTTTGIKHFIKNQKMESLYKLFAPFRKQSKSGKCPFRF